MAFNLYDIGIETILFSGLKADPEWVSRRVIQTLSYLDRAQQTRIGQVLQSQFKQVFDFSHPRLEQSLAGLSFRNPVGLAAGFDKDGAAAGMWSVLGFGFTELGTVTYHAQPGNPQPRLFRLFADHASLNRMGFNNQGAAALARTLQAKPHLRSAQSPVGINLGKSKVTPLEEAAQDYLSSFRLLQEWGDYFVVNVSSPNTPGLRSLQAVEQLEPILAGLQAENQQKKPLFVKIAPDLEWEDIAAVVDLAERHHLTGIIATNTTISRTGLKTQILPATGKPIQEEAGGISGLPLRQRSTEVIRFIRQQTQGRLIIIGVGGIFTAADAWEKITAGASLVQVYTGWIYEGPLMVRQIGAGLLQKLDEQGLSSIRDAVGLAFQ